MEQTLTVDPSTTNEVEIIAYNGKGLLATPPLRFKVDAWGPVLQERPRLFVLAMGVDKYARPDWQLRYAAKDASAFAEAIKAVAGAKVDGKALFADVQVKTLIDTQVTERSIAAEFERLAADRQGEGRVRPVRRRPRPLDRRRGLVLHPAGLRPRQGPHHREGRDRARQARPMARQGAGAEEPHRARRLRSRGQRGVPQRRPRARDGDGPAGARHRPQHHRRGAGRQGRLRGLQRPRRAHLRHPGGAQPRRKALAPGRSRCSALPRTSACKVPAITQSTFGIRQQPRFRPTGDDFSLGLSQAVLKDLPAADPRPRRRTST